jgi:hypothetical protein
MKSDFIENEHLIVVYLTSGRVMNNKLRTKSRYEAINE